MLAYGDVFRLVGSAWAAPIKVASRRPHRCMKALPVSRAGLVAGRYSSANSIRTSPGCCWSRPAWLAISAATWFRGPEGRRPALAALQFAGVPAHRLGPEGFATGEMAEQGAMAHPILSAMAAVLIASGAVVRATLSNALIRASNSAGLAMPFRPGSRQTLLLPVQRNTSSWGYPTRLGSRRP